jgi:hypothetical protein
MNPIRLKKKTGTTISKTLKKIMMPQVLLDAL